MEFLSEEWFEVTKETCQSHFNGRVNGKVVGRENVILGRGIFKEGVVTKETCRKGGVIGGAIAGNLNKKLKRGFFKYDEEELKSLRKDWAKSVDRTSVREMCKERNKELWMCTVTGKVSNKGGLSMYQKARGIDHKDPNNRIKIN